jgi:putative FmdB family regulatory protein
MPLYDYECGQCHTIFEVRASFEEKEAGLEPECPECQCKDVKQVISGGLVILGKDGISFSGPACGPNGGSGCCG